MRHVTGGGFFERAIMDLELLGLTDVLLPFILIFTIVFSILQKTEILGERKKNLNVILSLVLAFSVIIPHVMGRYPPNADVVVIINRALPNVSLVIVAILMVLLMIGIFGWKVGGEGTPLSGGIVLLAFVAVFFIFGAAANFWIIPPWLFMLRNPDTQALVVVILIFGIIVWFITKEEEPRTKGEGMLKAIGEQFFQKK